MGSDGQNAVPERESGAQFGLLTCDYLERATRFELATLTLAR